MIHKILCEARQLEADFGLRIPDDFAEFFVKWHDVSSFKIIVNNVKADFVGFITIDEKSTPGKLYYRYMMGADETADYLVFAFGSGNDEFAIKVKGDDIGGVYHIDDENEEKKRIRKIADSLDRFEEILKRNLK